MLISTQECAIRKGITRQAVVSAIQRGVLKAVKVGRSYVVEEKDCDAYTPLMAHADRAKRRYELAAESKKKRGRGRPRKNPVKGDSNGVSKNL